MQPKGRSSYRMSYRNPVAVDLPGIHTMKFRAVEITQEACNQLCMNVNTSSTAERSQSHACNVHHHWIEF